MRAKFSAILLLLIFLTLPLQVAQAHDGPHAGHTMDPFPYPHIHSIAWDANNPQHVWALGNPNAYESFDNGQSWEMRGDGVPTDHYARLVFHTASNTLYAYTPGATPLHRSVDGGRTWPVINERRLRDLVVESAARGRLWAITQDTVQGVFSDDGGKTWQPLNTPWDGVGDARLIMSSDGGLAVVGGGFTYRSTDGGKTWSKSGGWPANTTPVRLWAGDDNTLYAIAIRDGVIDPRPVGNLVLRSVRGEAWQAAAISEPRAAMLVARNKTVIVATWEGKFYRWNGGAWDNAANWLPQTFGLVQPMHLSTDVNPTPLVTDLELGADNTFLAATVLGIYRADTPGKPLLLRSRGLLPTAELPTTPLMVQSGTIYPTGHAIVPEFADTWQRLGGVRTMGYPISRPYLERGENNSDQMVQLFERGRLEMGTDGKVYAGRLVAELGISTPPIAARAGCTFVPETGHNVCGLIAQTWAELGGWPFLGLPLEEAKPGVDTSGNPVTVQYFERGRLEVPANATKTSEVMLGLVGTEEAVRRGWW